jgi:hypothetical protein
MGMNGINSHSSSARWDESHFQNDWNNRSGDAPRPGEPGFGGASPFGSSTNEWESASRPVQRLTADELDAVIFSQEGDIPPLSFDGYDTIPPLSFDGYDTKPRNRSGAAPRPGEPGAAPRPGEPGSGTTYADGAAPRPGEPGAAPRPGEPGAAPRPGEPGFGGASPFGSWTNGWVSASRPDQRLTADEIDALIFSQLR